MDRLWSARMQVSTEDVIHNINEIKRFIGDDVNIMPVIKDNGYGTMINDKFEIFDRTNIKIVAVAIVDEGAYLREKGYKGEIFVLNQPTEDEIPSIEKYNLIVGIGSIDFLSILGKHKSKFRIHMEIGTGMGRTGIKPNRTQEYIDEALKYDNITIDGVYTHFSCSDCDREYTKTQIELFNKSVEIVKKNIPNIRYIHCCNSAGILDYPEAHFNLVRPGIILYGYLPTEELKDKIDLRPCIKLKSRISFIKEVDKGTSISYGRTFITERKSIIATVPLGYADGIRRSLSNKGYVVIKGEKVPIVGTVCMDCFMVDVTDIGGADVGDDVYIWDNDKVTVEDIANIYGTINYEVISTISNRVIREFTDM